MKILAFLENMNFTKFSKDHINKIDSPHEFMGKNLHPVNSATSSSKIEYTLKGQFISKGNFGVYKSHKNWTKHNEGFLKWVEKTYRHFIILDRGQLPILPSKKTTKRRGGCQKSPILRRHSLWTAPSGKRWLSNFMRRYESCVWKLVKTRLHNGTYL